MIFYSGVMVGHNIVGESLNSTICMLCVSILLATKCDNDGGIECTTIVHVSLYDLICYVGARLGYCTNVLDNAVS